MQPTRCCTCAVHTHTHTHTHTETGREWDEHSGNVLLRCTVLYYASQARDSAPSPSDIGGHPSFGRSWHAQRHAHVRSPHCAILELQVKEKEQGGRRVV
jgi:hypothetical protein